MLSLNSLMTPLIEAGQGVFICGNFNADSYNVERSNRTKEKSLAAFVTKYKLIDPRIQSDFPEPTYFPADINKKSGTLDYIFTNKPIKYRSITNLVNPSSNHTIINITNSIKPPSPVAAYLINCLKFQFCHTCVF